MLCMTCDTEMRKIPYDGVLLDFCNKCGAVWADGDELRKLDDGEEHTIAEMVTQAKMEVAQERLLGQTSHLCPRCDSKRLTQIIYRRQKVETCDKCHGIFFDSNEFEQARENTPWLVSLAAWINKRINRRPNSIS